MAMYLKHFKPTNLQTLEYFEWRNLLVAPQTSSSVGEENNLSHSLLHSMPLELQRQIFISMDAVICH